MGEYKYMLIENRSINLSIKLWLLLGTVVYTCNSSTWQVDKVILGYLVSLRSAWATLLQQLFPLPPQKENCLSCKNVCISQLLIFDVGKFKVDEDQYKIVIDNVWPHKEENLKGWADIVSLKTSHCWSHTSGVEILPSKHMGLDLTLWALS